MEDMTEEEFFAFNFISLLVGSLIGAAVMFYWDRSCGGRDAKVRD
jgi:hypothetical protein